MDHYKVFIWSSCYSFYGKTETDVRQKVRGFFDLKRLPKGTAICRETFKTTKDQKEHFTYN